MKVALFTVMVLRSMDTHIEVTVPAHEVDLLRAVHGAEGVAAESVPVGELELGAVHEERYRLAAKYGMKNADTAWVDAVYPNDTALVKAVQMGVVDEVETAETPKPRGKKAADAPAV